MNEERDRLTVWAFVKGLFKVVLGLSLLAQSFLFLLVLVFVFAFFSNASRTLSGGGDGPSIVVPEDSALILNPRGVLVEEAPESDIVSEAVAAAIGGSTDDRVTVHELVRVIRAAAEDERIDALILDLQELSISEVGGASKAHYLASVVEDFRETGKRVIAVGDSFSQAQYLIASEADTILMHDMGGVMMQGYGAFNFYFASALEKLKVTTHIFRVGTFKSAVEPFLRDDMSPEAATANRAFIGSLWSEYVAAINDNRGLQGGVEDYAQNLPALVAAADGNMAQAALDAGLVDRLVDRPGQIAFLADIVGRDKDSEYGGINGVGFKTYRLSMPVAEEREDSDKIAIITVAGAIVDGEAAVGTAGGDSVARQLRRARNRDDVKAVVLRVDSPGGSAFASEIMRDEALALKAAGKPLVVSMGSLAASGGYWISADADEIWAAPTTITGSIGVFGLLTTFEDTLADIGVNTDGVGTTPLSASNIAGPGPLPDAQAAIIQSSIEHTYDQFLTIVAGGRDMTNAEVDAIGQGRVWAGVTAAQNGLVDKLGTIDDAIVSAAALAGIEDYDVVGLVRQKTPFELFLEGLAGQDNVMSDDGLDALDRTLGAEAGMVRSLLGSASRELRFLASFNDPNAIYLRCDACPVTD